MDSLIIQDSYWFVEGEGENSKMKAMCAICAKKSGQGWYWDKNMGYGNYDLFCSVCKNAIHLRGNIEAHNKNK